MEEGECHKAVSKEGICHAELDSASLFSSYLSI